ncbi:MAG: acyltransferase [Muribaculaceae bacterium]|nr:acyltransferase [Muribaculaceae bacterium]
MILIVIIVIALGAGVALTCRGNTNLHDFDTRATLPVRGLAALLIVLYHVSLNVPESRFLNLFSGTGALLVSIFFFISGYGLMVSYVNKGRDYLNGFLGHRFSKLLPPFLIAAIGYEIYQSTHPDHSTIASITAIAHGGTILPDSWFVITILIYYLLFYLVARLLRTPVKIVIGLWLTSAAYIALLYFLGWEQYWYITVCVFNFGTTYALLEDKIKDFFAAHRGALPCVAVLTSILIVACYMISVTMPIFYLLPLIIVFAIYAMGTLQSRVLAFLGTISYEIYIMQCIWRHKLFATADIHWSVYLLATLAMTIFTAWLLHRVCKAHIIPTHGKEKE